jgi:putative membrane protein
MDWLKIFHLLCVMGWMTGIFAVPRALIYWHREHDAHGPGGNTAQLTVRLFRFSAGLGVIAIILGLWKGYDLGFPVWVHIKTGLVGLLMLHYIYTGLLVKDAHNGIFKKSDRFLRIYNEISVFVVIAILWTVVEQPL